MENCKLHVSDQIAPISIDDADFIQGIGIRGQWLLYSTSSELRRT